jgi:hypothetical protein
MKCYWQIFYILIGYLEYRIGCFNDSVHKEKVKVPLTDRKVQRARESEGGGRVIAVHFLELGARCGWSAPRLGRFTSGKDPVPIVQ